MNLPHRTILAALVIAAPALAQQPAPPPSEAAAHRFPQPVRVGDLVGRAVLRPREDQAVLGRVVSVVRAMDGAVSVVVDYGGVLGLGARRIAIPADGMTLLGQDMEVVDFTPKQLDKFPAFAAGSAAPVPADESIRVGLSRPSH